MHASWTRTRIILNKLLNKSEILINTLYISWSCTRITLNKLQILLNILYKSHSRMFINITLFTTIINVNTHTIYVFINIYGFIYIYIYITMTHLWLFRHEIKQSIRFVYHWITEYHTSFHSHPCASMNLESQYFNIFKDKTFYKHYFRRIF